jgi:hypothetical protein
MAAQTNCVGVSLFDAVSTADHILTTFTLVLVVTGRIGPIQVSPETLARRHFLSSDSMTRHLPEWTFNPKVEGSIPSGPTIESELVDRRLRIASLGHRHAVVTLLESRNHAVARERPETAHVGVVGCAHDGEVAVVGILIRSQSRLGY